MNLLKSPSIGAIYHKCALQVNPLSYSVHFRGESSDQISPESYARLMVKKALELEISAIAVTNHNNVSDISHFTTAAVGTGLSVFPGFELSSSEGVHILCIYEIGTEKITLERYLGRFGIQSTYPSATPAKQTFVRILEIVQEQGGVSVAAHVNEDNGLFKVLEGTPRINAWTNKNLLAVQISSTVEALEKNYRDFVKNRDPVYKRTHPADDNLAVAVVNASDVTKPEDLDKPTATCWIKMSQLSIEGLKQAFLDPGSRIRLNRPDSESFSDRHTKLVSIAWEGGFLDESKLHFNSNLNVLIGGRGTGKSTIIESIRTVLGMEAKSDAATEGHTGIVQNVLKNGTKISLLIQTYEPISQLYKIERTIPNPPRVIDENDKISNLLPADVLPGIEIFGQHEILSLVQNKTKLTHLLKRFVKIDNVLQSRKAKVIRDLENNRRSLIDAQRELEQIGELLQELPRLKERLQRFIDAGLEKRLQEQSHVIREERILESARERIEPFQDSLTELNSNLPIDRTFISPKALEELPGNTVLAQLNTIFEDFEKDLNQVVELLDHAIQKAKKNKTVLNTKWQERKQTVQVDYEKILREMQVENLDGEDFINVRRRVETLQPLGERQETVKQILEQHLEIRKQLLAEWEEIKRKEFQELFKAAKKVNKLMVDRVKIDMEFEGDRTPVFDMLRGNVGGKVSSTIKVLESVDNFSLTSFVSACRNGKEEIVNAYGTTETQAEHLANADPEVFMQIEELELPTTATIALNVELENETPLWKELDELSTGQKATAILMHLLLESKMPLIIDQPEDDLDNRFITESIVPRIREGKQNRQFIFSTHNANIPVLGDAELICGLSAPERGEHGGGQIREEHLGSIDDLAVRELVEQILEGGEEAFERRRRKYGF